jgi:predicted dienelactone hydrolase
MQSPALLNQRLGRFLSGLGLMLLPLIWRSDAAWGAEYLQVSYGALERSIPVASLATYARSGKIDRELAGYLRWLKPEQLANLRPLLQAQAHLSPLAVSQFLYSPQGEILLQRLGDIVQTSPTSPKRAGFYATRAALVLAAADRQQGLTLLNVLQKFPTRELRIDLVRGLQVVGEIEKLVNQTQRVTTRLFLQSAAAADADPNGTQWANLQQPGQFRWQKITRLLKDGRRQRSIPVDVYVPEQPAEMPAPVIVLSHGVGSDRTMFIYLAEHLATYGFVVAVPEHPGSNAQQLQALLAGRVNQAAQPTEFIDRPLDVKYLLDELQRFAQSDPEFQGRMNLQQVGVMGHSFGGYTALALAGASLDFQHLQESCQTEAQTLNLSLLLQCRALQLHQSPVVNLQDSRIKAAIAINPLTSAVFNQASLERIQVPTMMVASSADTVTPALVEQIQPFTQLSIPNKYLVLVNRASHFSAVGEVAPGSGAFPIPTQVIGPNPRAVRNYLQALSVAFSQTHLAGRSQFANYLSSAYTQAISVAPLPLSLIRSLTPEQLTGLLKDSTSS